MSNGFEYKRKNIIEIGISYFHKKGAIALLCGIVWYFLSKTKSFVDDFRYLQAKKQRGPTGYVCAKVNDYFMYLDPDDKGICKQLYLYNKREHFSTDFIKTFIKEDDIIIDIGGNIGYYALLESKLARRGKIFAIEPVPSNAQILRSNIELNNSTNLYLFGYAISEKNGTAKMFIYDKCNWCSFTKSLKSNIIKEIEVKTITLDDFVDLFVHEYPNFIRMDVEGYEYQILNGAIKLLDASQPLKLCIELHPHLLQKEKMNGLICKLRDCNFEIKGIFLDPEARNFNNIYILNKLRKTMKLEPFGFIGNSYRELDNVLSMDEAPIVFFERS
jgi:FkbM family methyltransferase